MKFSYKTVLSTLVVSLFLLTVIGCDKSLSGKYIGDGVTIEFKDGGKAVVTVMNSPVDATYTITGNTVVCNAAGGATPPLSLTINDDGTLKTPDGSILKKQ